LARAGCVHQSVHPDGRIRKRPPKLKIESTSA
jgi:hypothetical protein